LPNNVEAALSNEPTTFEDLEEAEAQVYGIRHMPYVCLCTLVRLIACVRCANWQGVHSGLLKSTECLRCTPSACDLRLKVQ